MVLTSGNERFISKKRCLGRAALLSLCVSLLLQCGPKPDGVEKIFEDGVEVVINHLEPYSLPGEPSILHFNEVLSIDTEKDEIAETGLTNIESFALDSKGNLFFIQRRSSDNFIYKFDKTGRFVSSFGRKGQGPGEFEWGGEIQIDENDRIMAKDMTKDKFFIFDTDGTLLDEIKLDENIEPVEYLGDQKYLAFRQIQDPDNAVFRNYYGIANHTLSEFKEFYNFEFEDAVRATQYRPVRPGFVLGASATHIFIGNSKTEDYEILVYDFNGNLRRKIIKEFRPVEIPEEFKTLIKKVLGRYERGQELIKKLVYPPHMPAFRYLFTDGQGRLFVMTNEREGEREYWYDIFTKGGVFIGRTKLDNVQINYVEGKRYTTSTKPVKVKDDRLYCLREKDSGYLELKIYRMTWE